MVLLIAAHSPPIQLFELGHLFGPVLGIPVSPSRCIARQSCVSDRMQREEGPVAHLLGNLRICGELYQFGHHSQPLFAHEVAAVGHVAARAIADRVGWVVRKGIEELVQSFIGALSLIHI